MVSPLIWWEIRLIEELGNLLTHLCPETALCAFRFLQIMDELNVSFQMCHIMKSENIELGINAMIFLNKLS